MAFGLTAAVQKLLNTFATTQIAMQDRTKPYSTASIPLGDLLQQALSGSVTAKATLTVVSATNGGQIGAHALSALLPIGAKIISCHTDTTAALTSGGSATVAISAGSTALVAATAYNDSSLVGFETHSVTPAKLTVASALTVTVATAALTGGSIDVYVTYIP